MVNSPAETLLLLAQVGALGVGGFQLDVGYRRCVPLTLSNVCSRSSYCADSRSKSTPGSRSILLTRTRPRRSMSSPSR